MLICLLLLMALTLLGLAAATDANLQDRMAGNLDSARLSARIADATLAWAENWLLSLEGTQVPESCDGACGEGEIIRTSGTYPASPEHENADWWQSNGFPVGHDPATGEILDDPLAGLAGYWIVEEAHIETANLPAIEGYYRVFALGIGPDGQSMAVTESVFARPWGNGDWSRPLSRDNRYPTICRQFDTDADCGRLAWRQRL